MIRSDLKKLPGARESKLPGFIPPQLATTTRALVKEPPSGDDWLHELKFKSQGRSRITETSYPMIGRVTTRMSCDLLADR